MCEMVWWVRIFHIVSISAEIAVQSREWRTNVRIVHGIRRKTLLTAFDKRLHLFCASRRKIGIYQTIIHNRLAFFSSRIFAHMFETKLKEEKRERWRKRHLKENATWTIVKENTLNAEICAIEQEIGLLLKFSFAKLVFSCNTLRLSIANFSMHWNLSGFIGQCFVVVCYDMGWRKSEFII